MSTYRPGLRALSRSRALPAFFLLLTPIAALAADPPQLDPVVVTGTREPQSLSRSTADLVVISAERLRNTTADSVEDLLRREAGVQISRNGGPGQTSGYFVRGASTNGTVILVDGVRIGSSTLGQADLEALSLAQIDHIEVLRGPASGLYGADAVGGVVQIFTRRGDGAPRFTASVAAGGYGSATGTLGISGSTAPGSTAPDSMASGAQGAFDYAASVGRERSRGVSAIRPGDRFGYFNPDDDGYTRNAAQLRLGFTPAAGHRLGAAVVDTRLDSHYDSADYRADFSTDPSPDFHTVLRTRVATLDYRGEVSPLWTLSAQASHAVDDSASGGGMVSRLKTFRDQATWQNALQLAPGQRLVLAYEHVRERVEADGFADHSQRDNNAFIAGYAGSFGPHDVEASLRHDRNSAYGSNTTGSLGYAFALTAEWKLRAAAGKTFRAPTFNDLYYPNYGVATIRPERGRSVELGAEWQRGTARASATLFRNQMSDLIGYDSVVAHCPAGYAYGCANNTSRSRMQGATLAASERFGGLEIRGSVDFLDARDTATDVRLPRRAARQETLAADWANGPWSLGGSLLDVGARPDGGLTLGGYAVLDLRTGWRFLPQWRLEAKLLNALDHRVEPLRDYQGLGRQAWLGLRYDGQGL